MAETSSTINDSPYQLHAVSVIMAAELHRPSTLDHGSLVSHGIVAEDWDLAGAISTPTTSVVDYKNGIRWVMDPYTLTVLEDRTFASDDAYRVHDLARSYVEKNPNVPYLSLSLNWAFSYPQTDPLQWLNSRFLRPNVIPEGDWSILGVFPTFVLEVPGGKLRLTFGLLGDDASAESGESLITLDCSVYHGGPLTREQMTHLLDNWGPQEKTIVQLLDTML